MMLVLAKSNRAVLCTALCVSGKRPACKAVVHRFESGQCLVKEKRYYVRHLVAWSPNDDGGVWSDIHEVYTQPRIDYLKARLFHNYDTFLLTTRLERVLDWVWEKRTGLDFDSDGYMPPSIEHSLRCYKLDTQNQIVLGNVETPREKGLL